ncbi:MAG: hypothetical protein EAZ08_04280 [Cytophagales bacterium]|nr:MAG: hypothetical protein EAZ08_04280 [Cytophagales bacterium]
MTELKIQIADSFIQYLGKETVEKFVQDYVTKALLRLAAQEILADLADIDIEDTAWKEAREKAWQKNNYFINVIAHA